MVVTSFFVLCMYTYMHVAFAEQEYNLIAFIMQHLSVDLVEFLDP